MKTICVAGLKGGIGKTTTATSLAYLLAIEKEKSVLLIDADSQGNASLTFGTYDSVESGIVSLMARSLSRLEDMSDDLKQILSDSRGNGVSDLIENSEYGVDVITSNGYLDEVNALLTVEKQSNQINILTDAIAELNDMYDFCIIDCGLKLDITVVNAILAANLILSPMRIGGYELNASELLDNQIFDLRELNPDVEIFTLITCFQKSKTTLAIEENLRDRYLDNVLDSRVRNSVVVMGKSFANGPLPYNSKNSIAVKDYRAVLDELMEVI